jgi:hypothetical protein
MATIGNPHLNSANAEFTPRKLGTEGCRFSGGGEKPMDRKGAPHWVCSIVSGGARRVTSPSLRSETGATLRLSRGEMLILVLLLSLGLWALIWGAISLLAAFGLR